MNHSDIPLTGGMQEPNAASRATARMARDMFTALTLEGFSESQALQLVAVMISANIQRGDTR